MLSTLWHDKPPANDLEHLDAHLAEQVPIWWRVHGIGNPHLIRETLKRCRIPGCFAPLVLDTPHSTRVDSMGDVIAVVMHRLRSSVDPLNLTSDQASMLLTRSCLMFDRRSTKPWPLGFPHRVVDAEIASCLG